MRTKIQFYCFSGFLLIKQCIQVIYYEIKINDANYLMKIRTKLAFISKEYKLEQREESLTIKLKSPCRTIYIASNKMH